MGKRGRKRPEFGVAYLIGATVILILVVIGIIVGVRSCSKEEEEPVVVETETETETEAPTMSEAELEALAAEAEAAAADAAIEAELDSYGNLGICQVDDGGYLNVRMEPSTDSEAIGKLFNHSACSIEEEKGEWSLISSGGFKGYVKSEYLTTGDYARELAKDYISLRAIVTADKLNVRAEPYPDAEVINKAYQNERYEVQGQPEGWVRLEIGYVSADYVELRECLNEARKIHSKE